MSAPEGSPRRRPIGVAVAGMGWMGRVHTQAYARVMHHFPQLTVRPEFVAVADEAPAGPRKPPTSSDSPRPPLTGGTWPPTCGWGR